jgi:hypothetical protein
MPEFEKEIGRPRDLKALGELPAFAPPPVKEFQPVHRPQPPPRAHGDRLKEEVVNSTHIKYKPCDRVAARVVAPAQDINKPPRPAPVFVRKRLLKAKKMKPQEFGEGPQVRSKKQLTEDGHVEDYLNMDDVAPLAVDEHAKKVKEGVRGTAELLEKSQDLIATIDYLSSQIREPWDSYQAFIKKALEEVRGQRIALGSETRNLLIALKDVRAFFLDKDYETEVRRLHEFIDLCERLKALKDAGFLDTIADTLIKLQG